MSESKKKAKDVGVFAPAGDIATSVSAIGNRSTNEGSGAESALITQKSSSGAEQLNSYTVNQVKAQVEATVGGEDFKKRLDGLIKEKVLDSTKEDRFQTIQILALFVAFFTFVSVQFQILQKAKTLLALISLSSLLIGALLIFVSLIYFRVKVEYEGRRRWYRTAPAWIFGIGVFCLLAGMVVGVYSSGEESRRMAECTSWENSIYREKSQEHPDGLKVDMLSNRYNADCSSQNYKLLINSN